MAQIVRQWQFEELNGLLESACLQHEDIAGGAVIMGDAIHGHSLLDQIPHELKSAFKELMGEKADTPKEMQHILLKHISAPAGGFRALDDRHVVGFVNKLKGQIGENQFRQHVGTAAALAPSKIQEAWDVSFDHDGVRDYIQVKLHGNAHGVVRHMVKVHEKVLHGLDGLHGEQVNHVYFAVPADIHDEVQRLVEHHDLSHVSVYHQTIPICPRGAADIVNEGMCNVGPDQLSHFFNELLCGALAAGSLHAVVNGFLWYKGSKEIAAAIAETVASTGISTVGIGVGLIAETLCHATAVSTGIGLCSRIFLGRVARSRWDFADFLEKSIKQGRAQRKWPYHRRFSYVTLRGRVHGPEALRRAC